MLAHIHHRYAILVVYIDSGLKSCGGGIDRFRSLSVFSEIELFCCLHHSLCLCKNHIGRISCCLADFWAAERHWLLLAVLLPAQCVCVCVCTPLVRSNRCLCIHTLYIHLIFVPFVARAYVRVSDLFPAPAVPSR